MKRKERIQEKKTKEKNNPSSSTKKKEYIYINIHRPLRNESKIRRGKWRRRGGIPLKKSSHPGVISVYSGMTRRIPSTRKKPVSSAPSRICLPACLPASPLPQFERAWKKLRREKYREGVLS